MKKLKIGIYGGSYYPIHIGHLITAQYLVEKLNLDLLVFVPNNIPNSEKIPSLDADTRFSLVWESIKENDKFRLSRVDMRRGGISYSIDTVRDIKKECREEHDYYLLIGSDCLETIHLWKDYEQLTNEILIMPYKRGKLVHCGFPILDVPQIDISSTEIRNRIKDGKSIKYMVPECVYKYFKNESR